MKAESQLFGGEPIVAWVMQTYQSDLGLVRLEALSTNHGWQLGGVIPDLIDQHP